MIIWYLPGEADFLALRLLNGSGWLTSHRLILIEHERGHLDEGYRQDFWLKGFKKAQVENATLTVHFKGKQQAKIQLPIDSPNLLQEIKDYIERASQNHRNR